MGRKSTISALPAGADDPRGQDCANGVVEPGVTRARVAGLLAEARPAQGVGHRAALGRPVAAAVLPGPISLTPALAALPRLTLALPRLTLAALPRLTLAALPRTAGPVVAGGPGPGRFGGRRTRLVVQPE